MEDTSEGQPYYTFECSEVSSLSRSPNTTMFPLSAKF